MKLTIEDIALSITGLIARNPLWKDKEIETYFIANETAGCFSNKFKSDFYKKFFLNLRDEIALKPVVTKSVNYKIFTTEYAGHAKDLSQSIVTQLIASHKPNLENIIITAGGDGTSLEVEYSLYNAILDNPMKKDAIMNKITLLRLPLGTGNDGTDGHCIEETVELLKGPLAFKNIRAVKVYPENNPTEEQIKQCKKKPEKYGDISYKAPWYAFNITSIGLDAYVVYMTNVFKKKFPGNLYQLCVPLSGLIYDKDFPSGTATVHFYDEDNNETDQMTCPISLLAFGESGNRVYGGGHHILPNEHNVCVVPKVTLLTLIKENHRFIDGSFVDTDIGRLRTAHKIKIEYDKPILLQCDGEVTLLTKNHFPLIMEKTEPTLRVIDSRSGRE